MKEKKTTKITLAAILSSAALLSFLLENLFPPLFIPGARLGLSNVFILLAFYMLGTKYAITVFLIKAILGSVFSGNVSSVIYSLPSGAISLIIELLLLKTEKFGVVSVSILGGIINLTLQNATFCLITKATEFFIYLPYLALIGCLAGATVGLTVYFTTKILPEKYFIKINENTNVNLEDTHSEY